MQLLETDRLLLRPFTLDDAEGLYAYASHPEVGPPAGWRPHRSVEESRQVIENIFIPSDALAVLRKSDGRLTPSTTIRRNMTRASSDWRKFRLKPSVCNRI